MKPARQPEFAHRKQCNILIVEDNASDRLLYQHMLDAISAVHFTADEATTLAQARKALSQKKYDCILLDCNLPDGNGVSMVTEIRQVQPYAAIVMLTVDDREETAVQSLKTGAEDYLIKGQCDSNILSRALRYAMERTNARKENEVLQRALQNEHEVNLLRRDFVTTVSHEFRTPLAVVDSATQLMRGKLKTGTTDGLEKHLDKIDRSVERLLGLLENTLHMAWLENVEITPYLEKINIKSTIEELIQHFQQAHPERAYVLEWEGNSDLFATDKKLFEHVMNNLIGNASKYSTPKEQITVRASGAPCQLTVQVVDKGPGIPQEEQEKIFNQFYRASTSITSPGSGVGLYITKRFIELLAGDITVSSDKNTGSTFQVVLPCLSNHKCEFKPH